MTTGDIKQCELDTHHERVEGSDHCRCRFRFFSHFEPGPAKEADTTLKLKESNLLEWEAALDDLGHREGFKDNLSECVDNIEEFSGLTPREALQQGWYDYPD